MLVDVGLLGGVMMSGFRLMAFEDFGEREATLERFTVWAEEILLL